MGEKTIPFKTVAGAHICIKFRSASVVKLLISMRNIVQAGSVVVLDEKNPHIRNVRDGSTGCIPWTCGYVLMNSARFSTGAGVVNGSSVTSKFVRPRKECSSEDEDGHVGIIE